MKDPRNPSGEVRTPIRNRVKPVEAAAPAFSPNNNVPNPVVPPKTVVVNTVKKMRHNLFVNYYIDKNKDRQEELNSCIIKNIDVFDSIIVVSSKKDADLLMSKVDKDKKAKVVKVECEVRPSFSDYFVLISVFNAKENLNVIANLDIIFEKEMLIAAEDYVKSEKTLNCLALTRWDIKPSGEAEFYNHADSQDVWIFQGDVDTIAEADFPLGKPGCDNKIAFLLEKAGYNVLNPSLTIKTFHKHLVEVRNYLNEKGEQFEPGIPPPYKILTPTL